MKAQFVQDVLFVAATGFIVLVKSSERKIGVWFCLSLSLSLSLFLPPPPIHTFSFYFSEVYEALFQGVGGDAKFSFLSKNQSHATDPCFVMKCKSLMS